MVGKEVGEVMRRRIWLGKAKWGGEGSQLGKGTFIRLRRWGISKGGKRRKSVGNNPNTMSWNLRVTRGISL